jgi:hypothetical protein
MRWFVFVQSKGQPYNPKEGNKNFYKGYGCAPMGRHTRKGPPSYILTVCVSADRYCKWTAAGFIVERAKIPQYIVPDLTGFEACA